MVYCGGGEGVILGQFRAYFPPPKPLPFPPVSRASRHRKMLGPFLSDLRPDNIPHMAESRSKPGRENRGRKTSGDLRLFGQKPLPMGAPPIVRLDLLRLSCHVPPRGGFLRRTARLLHGLWRVFLLWPRVFRLPVRSREYRRIDRGFCQTNPFSRPTKGR
jgi:hypothetical protein